MLVMKINRKIEQGLYPSRSQLLRQYKAQDGCEVLGKV